MPATYGQQLWLLYRTNRGHGPRLQTFNNNVYKLARWEKGLFLTLNS